MLIRASGLVSGALQYVWDVQLLSTRAVDAVNSLKEYRIQDHLGSARVLIAQGGSVTGRLDYTPFGGILWQSGTAPRRTYIDREEDAESLLGEFEARKYDDGIGRFTGIDEDWEEYREHSPYNYAENNPVVLKDPSGYNPVMQWLKKAVRSPGVRKVAPKLSKQVDKAERQAERWANRAFNKTVRWVKDTYNSTKETIHGWFSQKKAADPVGELLNRSKFDKILSSKGNSVQFQNDGSAKAMFQQLAEKLGVKAKDIRTNNGVSIFRSGNRTFTVRGDSKGTHTISIKTDNNSQQLIIRFANE